MKRFVLGAAAIAACAGVASAHTTYLDPFGTGGDVHPFFLNQGLGTLDLVATEMFNDDGLFEIDVLVDGDLTFNSTGKFLLSFDTRAGGRTDNPWNRNIVNTSSADFFVAGWSDGGGGAELWTDTGAGWTLLPSSLVSVDLTNAAVGVWHLDLDQAILGVVGGQEIHLDVATSGPLAGDPGVDHLSLGSIATPNWTTGSVSGDFLHYEVEPTPGSIAVLGIAGLLTGRRRRN